jgi:hypothetical protein
MIVVGDSGEEVNAAVASRLAKFCQTISRHVLVELFRVCVHDFLVIFHAGNGHLEGPDGFVAD